jgi:hypothetical protein
VFATLFPARQRPVEREIDTEQDFGASVDREGGTT